MALLLRTAADAVGYRKKFTTERTTNTMSKKSKIRRKLLRESQAAVREQRKANLMAFEQQTRAMDARIIALGRHATGNY